MVPRQHENNIENIRGMPPSGGKQTKDGEFSLNVSPVSTLDRVVRLSGRLFGLKNENAIPVGRRGILFEHMDARRMQVENRSKTKAITDFAASGN